MRLVTITHCYPARGGGIERVASRLIDEFVASGLNVEWVSSDTAPPPESMPGRVATPIPTINIIERLTRLPYPIWTAQAFGRLWRAIGRADLVHIHEHLYVGSMLAALIAWIRGRPLVITQHSGAQGLGNRASTALYCIFSRLVGMCVFPAGKRVVFVSANVRSFFKLQADERARLIFNGTDPDLFSLLPLERRTLVRAQLALPTDRRVVLFVGRFLRKKGLDVMERLASRMPGIQWLFVGAGPDDPSAWRLAQVTVAGQVDQATVASYYHASDLLLLPSHGEGFPLVVQEALACGLGVLSTTEVASACPQASHLIRAVATPRNAVDTEAWEQALRSVLEDQNYLDDRSSRAFCARQLWSWKNCAAGYLQLFQEVRKS